MLYRAEPETVQADRRATAPVAAEREKQAAAVKKNTGIAQAANAVKRMSGEIENAEAGEITGESEMSKETETATENETKDGE